MNEPNRRINTFDAFCSLMLPGLGQLLQKRVRAAVGFFLLFILTGLLPVTIVCLLFMDRFEDQPLRVHLLHIFTFGGLFFLCQLAIFWSVLDAAEKWKKKPNEQQDEKPSEKKKGCFTLVKILVAVVIMGVLIALLLPSVPVAREAAKRMSCTGQMKQMLLGFHNYFDQYGCFPPAYTMDESGKPLHSWRVLILPNLEQNAIYEKIRLDEPWDSEYNCQFHSEAPSIYQCPSANAAHEKTVPVQGGCFYSVIDGEEAAFFGSQTKSMPPTTSLQNIIFIVERRIPVNWMDPSREITFEAACKGINVDAMGISSYHSGGVNVGMGDYNIRFISDSIDSETLRTMLMFNQTQIPMRP